MSNEINFNDSMKRISDYLQSQKAAESKDEKEKTLADVDVETIFSEFKGNGIEAEQFAVAFAEDYLEKEIKDASSLDAQYINDWKDIATYDDDDNSIAFDEVQELLDAFRESQLPDDWKVKDGVVTEPGGREVEARDLEEGHKVKDGKIYDADGNQVGVVAEVEKDGSGDGVKDTVESFYYFKEEAEAGKPDPDNGETAVAKGDLPEGHTIKDGKIYDKDGNEIGRIDVSYSDATGDGVNDKVTSYYLYNTEPPADETKLPDDWTKNEDGTITDNEGNALGGTAVQAEDLAAMGYEIKDDGYIYDAQGNPVGRNFETEVDTNGDGVADISQSCYLYADTEATKPEGFPEDWTMNKDGTITDENGNVLGGVADDAKTLEAKGYTITDDGYIYPPGADTSDPAKAVGRSYSYETTDADGNPVTAQACYFDASYEVQNPDAPSTPGKGEPDVKLPDGLSKDENGKITDENGRELTPVAADDKSLEGLTEKDGEYYNEFGQKLAITGEDGTVYKYNELPELEAVAKTKDEALPADKNYEIDADGNIIDKDTGFKVGYVDVSYADATGDGVNDKITSYYIYEEVEPENPTGTPSETPSAPSDAPSTPSDAPSAPSDVPSTPSDAPSTPSDVPSTPSETPSTPSDVPSTPSETPSTPSDSPSVPSDSPSVIADPPEPELPTLQTGNDDKTVITDDAADLFAKQLYEATAGRLGTDEQQFNDILNHPDLTPDDWVKIISSYNEAYGSFIQDVDGDFSKMSGKEDIMTQISSKLLEAAAAGNEEAIDLLAKEIHNGTAGMSGTADEFIAAIMNSASDEVLAGIMESYSEVNDGASIYDAFKADFSGKTEDAYIKRLNEILAKIRE